MTENIFTLPHSLGEVNYNGYARATGGVSLITGEQLPPYAELDARLHQAWSAGAVDVITAWRASDAEAAGPERYALVEMLGYRRVVGAVTETEFCGRPMLEVRPIPSGSVQLVGPDSLYQLTWLTRDQAELATRTGAHSPAAIGSGRPVDHTGDPDPWAGDPLGDDEDAARDMAAEDGDLDRCEPTL
jgi:hypothetical protein